MTSISEAVVERQGSLARVEPLGAAGEPERVRQARQAAAERFNETGLPTTRTEAWRHTSLAALARTPFRLAERAADGGGAFEGATLSAQALAELVFVNGLFAPDRSTSRRIKGLKFQPLRSAMANPLVAREYARYADYQQHPLTALNTALAQDGALIEVEEGAVVDGFVHILFIADSGHEAVMSHPRNLIVAHSGSHLAVVESYAGSGSAFSNAVTELVLRDGAVVEHTKIQRDAASSAHIGTLQVHQERSSSLSSHTVAFGGAIARNEINVALAGEGASCTLEGLFVAAGHNHVDNHTVIDHARPHCDSHELFKGILDDDARGVFDGTIIVRQDAQKTNARQVNKNLLLSERAIVDSKPTLEIHADDVKCSHGSTIGQLDDDALFYLRSRAIGEQEARNLLIGAFASELIDRLGLEPVREAVRRTLSERLPRHLSEHREGAP